MLDIVTVFVTPSVTRGKSRTDMIRVNEKTNRMATWSGHYRRLE